MKRSILTFLLLSMILEPVISQLGTTYKTGSREGWSIGVEGSYGISSIENNTLSVQTIFDNYTWESRPGFGMSAAVNGYYFFEEYFGIKSGIAYSNYESSFLLNGTLQDSELSKDINDDSYYKVSTADYNSDINLSYISLPIVANLSLGKPGKNGVYLEGGAMLEQRFISSSHLTGSYELYGYYPFHPEVVQILRISDLGFYSLDDIEKTEDITTSFFNISGYLSFGLNLAFGYVSTVRLGAELIYGGSRKMDYGFDYERFYNAPVIQPVFLKKYSIKLSYILKL